MKKRILPFVLSVILTAISLHAGQGQKKGERLNVLLITIDTLRSDRLSCYGSKLPQTPNMDRLAEKGALFTRAFAHTSTTLPSHTNILLGTTPLFHGVHDNANFMVRQEFLSLAELLKEAGYSTGAFVGGYPLDSRFGLNQGFDVYDDDFYAVDAPYREDAERKAERVIEQALAWLKGQKAAWFLWIHCYDPHDPYEPPEPFLSRYKNAPYDGEVAYVDHALGRLLDSFEKESLYDNTLIILTGDHGESLGRHGEMTHGFFAYNTTIWIPLIIAVPGLKPGRINRMAAHIDIFPTVCEIVNIGKPDFLQGISLVPAIKNKKLARRAVYFESLSPYYSRGWAPIRGYIEDKTKFVESPIPELYDLGRDFDELENLAEGKDPAPFKKALDGIVKALSFEESLKARQRTDTRSLETLRSLGYLSRPGAAAKERFGPEDDVKALLPYHEKSMKALALCQAGQVQEGIDSLREVITEKPDMDVAYANLASVYQSQGKLNDSLEVLKAGLESLPSSYDIFSSYVRTLAAAGEHDKVIDLFDTRRFPQMDYDAEVWNYLGLSYRKKGDFEKALMAYNMAVSIDEKYPVVHNNLGTLYFSIYLKNHDPKAFERALRNFDKAVELDPYYASPHYGMGIAFIQSAELDKAITSLEKALKLQPDFGDAVYNLGLAYFRKGDYGKALPHLGRYRQEYGRQLAEAILRELDEMILKCRRKPDWRNQGPS